MQAATEVAKLGDSAVSFAVHTDTQLMQGHDQITALRRQVDRYAAWMAGEIARRSTRDLGYAGLAQRNGFLTPEAMIQATSGGTRTDATRLVAVGTMLNQTETAEELHQRDPGSPLAELPWLASVAGAVRSGALSVDAADAIRKGLGDIDPGVPAEKLAAAAQFLQDEAARLNADQLLRRARHLRDELDADGIARRERTQRDARSFRIWKQPDGMYRISALLAPEDGRLVESIIDEATTPRRGGPRFVDKDLAERAQALRDDERSTEQIAADTFVALLHIAVEADPNTVFFGRRPNVRILVTEKALHDHDSSTTGHPGNGDCVTGGSSGSESGGGDGGSGGGSGQPGHGTIEGHPNPVSMETVERLLCTGYTGIKFDDDGQCVNVGRNQRLFTERQRIGLAARDGGCRWPECDRPTSWTEAHHIDHWDAENGLTDIADGVLLCRGHHLLLHNNHWHVTRNGNNYWLIPPTAIDPRQTPVPMPSKKPPS